MTNCNVISHRGANRVAPQNTIEAFKRSIEIGCDGFETDIHLTKDGIPVVCHNFTIDETSTGKGAIKNMTLEELRQYDFGSYKGPEFKGIKIPTLDEFLEVSKSMGDKMKVMNIEMKRNAEVTTIEITGRLDTTTAPVLDKMINEDIEGTKDLILDMKGLEYISSAGLRVLLSAQKKMMKIGSMKVVNVCESVMEVLEMTGFADILVIE
jgi:anti-anti-sigma factor